MKQNLYYIQLISTDDMEIYEVIRTSNVYEHIIKESRAVAKCYITHGYNLDTVKIYNSDKKLLVTYDL